MILDRHGLGLVVEGAQGLAVLDHCHGAAALTEEGQRHVDVASGVFAVEAAKNW